MKDERKLSLPMGEYLNYYDETGAIVVIRQSGRTRNEELLKLYFDVSIADNNEIQKSKKVIYNVIERTTNAHIGLSTLRDHICKVIATNMENKKLSGAFIQMMSSDEYSSECADTLAAAGLSCNTLLTNKNLSEKQIRHCFKNNKMAYMAQFASNPSTPSDIQAEIADYRYNELIKQYGTIKNVHFGKIRDLILIARYTKDDDLIARMYTYENTEINKELKHGAKARSDMKALVDIAVSNKTTRKKRLWLVRAYFNNERLMSAVASGNHVDMGIYMELMKIPYEDIKAMCMAKLIFNKELLDESVLFKLAARSDTKDLVEPYVYKKLLSRTEIATINVSDFGIIGFKESKNDYLDELKKSPNYKVPGEYFIAKQTTTIPNKKGIKFGFFYDLDLQLSIYGANITHKIVYQEGQPYTDAGKVVTVEVKKEWSDKGESYAIYQELSEPWELKPGLWEIEISHRDHVIAKKAFYVVKE